LVDERRSSNIMAVIVIIAAVPLVASPKLRAGFILAAAIMLGLWGASLIPAVKVFRGPARRPVRVDPGLLGDDHARPARPDGADGRHLQPRGARPARPRPSLFIAGGVFVVVLLLEALRRMSMIGDG
jgi:hypothetical protein